MPGDIVLEMDEITMISPIPMGRAGDWRERWVCEPGGARRLQPDRCMPLYAVGFAASNNTALAKTRRITQPRKASERDSSNFNAAPFRGCILIYLAALAAGGNPLSLFTSWIRRCIQRTVILILRLTKYEIKRYLPVSV
ncbi:hypothetical protein KCP70_23885 [Salmonella enterica subsp. enterica]|nr:hypothetical protein KCP70_23885 [Salmonella enterica subsp. enterica]